MAPVVYNDMIKYLKSNIRRKACSTWCPAPRGRRQFPPVPGVPCANISHVARRRTMRVCMFLVPPYLNFIFSLGGLNLVYIYLYIGRKRERDRERDRERENITNMYI